MHRKPIAALVVAACLAGAAARAEDIAIEIKDGKFASATNMADHIGHNEGDNRVFMYSKGTAEFKAKVPADGEYVLKLEMACDPAMDKFAQVKVAAGGAVVKEKFDLTQGDAKEYSFDVKLKQGETTVSVEFLNDLYKEGEYDLNFYLHSAKLVKKPAAKQ